jgi:hypothetical protein
MAKKIHVGTVLGVCVGAWQSLDLAKAKVQHDAPKLGKGYWTKDDDGDWLFLDYKEGDIVGMVQEVQLSA